ncbi:MAG: class I SAM-dependent methyltransferase [Archangium sp.]
MEDSEFEKHEQLEAEHWWFEGRRRCIAAALDTHLKPASSRTILDVGCGTGGMFDMLKRYGTVEGAEYSPDARARATRRFPDVKVSPCELPDTLPDGKFTIVTAFDVVEHLDDPVASLRALRARIAGGGQLVVTVPAYQFLWSEHDVALHHRRRYTRGLLRKHLNEAGFHTTWDSYFNTTLFPVVAAARLKERVLGRAEGQSDLQPAPALANFLLTRVFGNEGFVLKRARLPFGVSLIAVAEPA